MYLTEEEAKGIHCPLIAEGRQIYIETGVPEMASACMGRQCPEWRWHWITIETPKGWGLVEIRREPSEHGYCGLGGKP